MPKKFLAPFKMINAGDASQASLTSAIVDIRYIDNVSIQFIWTGTPTGTFAVQTSSDYNPTTGVSGTWDAMTLSSTPAPAGSASSGTISLNQLDNPYIRVVYTKTSGTGAITAIISGKGL